MINPDRAVVGLATVFDQPALDDGQSWSAAQFEAFLDLELGIDLRVNHGALIDPHGYLVRIGVCRRFASVSLPIAGLLMLAEIDYAGGYGDQLLHDLGMQLSQRWLDPGWAFSVAAHIADDGAVIPYEVSVTRRPAYPDAKILAVGSEAVAVWDMLTEERIAA